MKILLAAILVLWLLATLVAAVRQIGPGVL